MFYLENDSKGPNSQWEMEISIKFPNSVMDKCQEQ